MKVFILLAIFTMSTFATEFKPEDCYSQAIKRTVEQINAEYTERKRELVEEELK